jgi:hypothetical protein
MALRISQAVKANKASIVLSGETPGKDELKFYISSHCLQFDFDFPLSLAFKILSIKVVY